MQKMVCGAAAGILLSMQKLHNSALPLAGRLSDPRDKAQFDTANETIASLGDVIALLGMASQEISMLRKYQVQSCLPKEVNSICSNENLASTNLLFGGDLDKALREAREFSKLGWGGGTTPRIRQVAQAINLIDSSFPLPVMKQRSWISINILMFCNRN